MSRMQHLAAAATIIILSNKKKKRIKNRRIWVRRWIAKREEEGVHAKLLKELLNEDVPSYHNFLRMSHTDYEYLLQIISFKIKKQDTHLRKSISPSERLSLTLRFLATGDSYHSLMYLFRIPVSTISKIIPEVCLAIYEVLKNDYFQIPNSNEQWETEAKDFEELWNFPNCIGALDGKHVVIRAPENSGSLYFNYKGTHSVVLMALVNASYKFLYVDVGSIGRISDGGVFTNCSLSSALDNNYLNIPNPRPLRGQSEPMPFVVVADDAFALKPNLMKPFPFKNQPGPNRVFNYRLSRARRVVENGFGLISARFRILRRPMELSPDKVTNIILAICTLHNFLLARKSSKHLYAPNGFLDSETAGVFTPGNWRKDEIPSTTLYPLQRYNSIKNTDRTSKQIREQFKEYFVSADGEVHWQYKYI